MALARIVPMTGYNGTSVAARLAAAFLAAGSLLCACGQKGPLYIPGVEHPEGGVRRLPLPSPASAASAPASAPAPSVPSDVGVTLPLPAASGSSGPSSGPSAGH